MNRKVLPGGIPGKVPGSGRRGRGRTETKGQIVAEDPTAAGMKTSGARAMSILAPMCGRRHLRDVVVSIQNSPFAALGALKSALEKRAKEQGTT